MHVYMYPLLPWTPETHVFSPGPVTLGAARTFRVHGPVHLRGW